MKRKRKTISIYDALGNMTPDQIAQATTKIFSGELMTCIMCGRQEKSDPLIESQWRIIQLNGTSYYACPDEFPPDGSSKEKFSQAYYKILQKILLNG